MGEKQNKSFQLCFNGFLKVDFQGSGVTSDGGLILVRELDEHLGLSQLIEQHLTDPRGTNSRLPLADLLRQSVYSRLAGYEDVNDAERLSQDPTFRLVGSEKTWDRGAALTSRLQSIPTPSVSLLPPLGGFLRLAPRLIELDDPFAGAVQVIPVRDADPVFPRQHPLIAFEQQRFGFGVFLLSGQAGAQQALGAESLPVIRLLLSIELQGLAREGLALGELPLRQVGQRQVGRRCHRVRVFRAQGVPSPRQGLRGISLRQGVFALSLVHGCKVREECKGVGMLRTQHAARGSPASG